MDKDVDDLHIKPSDAMDHSTWRKMFKGNWNDRSGDNDAESQIQIVHFWCWLTQVNLDITGCPLVMESHGI